MNIYEQRWNNALKWANKVKSYFDTGNYLLEWEERYDPTEHVFAIDEVNKLITINSKRSGYSIQVIYEYDLKWDHGSYTTISETNKFLEEFKLFKQERIFL